MRHPRLNRFNKPLKHVTGERPNNRSFREVKLRAGSGFGGAVGAVDREKRRRVRQAARIWLSRHPQAAHVRIGFEVAAVEEGRLTRISASLDDGW